jgi:hypothetical protein
MGAFYEDFKRNINPKGIKESHDLIISDLLQYNLKGDDKQKSLTGYNMESDAMNKFIPSMFYIFLYNNPNSKNEIDDYVPMILCTGFNHKNITGINFNLLPNNIRALFIDFILDIYPDFYTEKNLNSGKLEINVKLTSILIDKGASVLIEAFKLKTGYDLSTVVRVYNHDYIIKCRMIEYDMWKYIPLLSFNDSLRGLKLVSEQLKFVRTNK